MNDLAELVEFLVNFNLGASQAVLAGIDGVGKQLAAFLDFLRIAARIEFDSLVFKEALQVLVKFVFF